MEKIDKWFLMIQECQSLIENQYVHDILFIWTVGRTKFKQFLNGLPFQPQVYPWIEQRAITFSKYLINISKWML